MKKTVLSKKVIQSLIIITVSLIIVLILFSIFKFRNSKNDNSMEVASYSSSILNSIILDNETNNSEEVEQNDTNELVDISNLENNTEEYDNKNNDNKKNKTENLPRYYIKINNRANRVNVYEKDENGEYTKLVRGMICSTGEATPPCSLYPKTKYKMLGNRTAWAKFHTVYVRYPTRIVGGIFFHSVPYLTQSNDGLSYNMFDNLGKAVSAGCIRLQVVDAKWIYDNIPAGTTVEFNTKVTNGASAPKISSNELCRNWDPTDTDSSNPWKDPSKRNYVKNHTTIDSTKENEKTNNNDSKNNKDNNNSNSDKKENPNTNGSENTNKNNNVKDNTSTNTNTKVNNNTSSNTNTNVNNNGSSNTNTNTKVNNNGSSNTTKNTSKNENNVYNKTDSTKK